MNQPLKPRASRATRVSTALLASVCMIAAAGCKETEPVDGSAGELHSVSFAYQRSCFFGCPLGQPLLVGTRETISLSDPGDVEGVKVKSSDEDVAIFAVERECFCERGDDHGGRIEIANDATCSSPYHKHCDNSVLVETHAEGNATLELRGRDGGVIDRIQVLARVPRRAQLFATYPDELGERPVDEVSLVAGDTVDVSAELYDDEGRELLAPEGVNWASNDPEVATVFAFLKPPSTELSAGLDVVVQGEGAGIAKLTLQVADFDENLRVVVSDAE